MHMQRILSATALTVFLSFCIRPALAAPCGVSAPNIAGGQYDSYRTNSNLQETVLNPASVGSGFGYLFQLAPAAGPVYAQPLILHNWTISGTCYATVVFVATMRNQIFAFDGDNPTGAAPIWKSANFTTAAASGSVYFPALYCKENVGFTRAGILSTPVIDTTNDLMYFVTLNDTQKAATCTATGSTGWVYTIHAISLRNNATFGLDLLPPHDINPDLAPNGFVASNQLQRPALAEIRGTILVGFGFGTSGTSGNELESSYQGWMAQYNSCETDSHSCPSTTCLSRVNCSFFLAPENTPGPLSPVGAGVWMSGIGPASDGTFYAYSTGNGCRPEASTTPTTCTAIANNALGDSVVYRPRGANSNPGSTFTPENSTETPGYQNYYVDDYNDLDLDAGGVLMIPPTVPKATSSYLIAAGKAGQTYVLQTANLGGYTSTPYQSFLAAASAPPCATPFPVSPQTPVYSGIVPLGSGCAEIHGPAYWNLGGGSGFYFVWGFNDIPRGYYFDGSYLETSATSAVPPITGTTIQGGGGQLAISANGADPTTALLWATTSNGFTKTTAFQQGALTAFQLYQTGAGYEIQPVFNSQAASGKVFSTQRYVAPLVNNGKVYVSTINDGNGTVFVYGPCSQGPNGVCGTQPAE